MLIRIFDILVSIMGLLVLSPILILTGVFIKIDSKGSVLFWQKRVGLAGREFWIVKFRTMLAGEKKGKEITSSANIGSITKAGKYIRKLHLDEVVQLYNVLKGEMSLVGPRPEVPKYVKYHKELWKKILSVKPGITGYATINLVDEEYTLLSKSKNPEKDYIDKILPKKLLEETFYIDNRSFQLNVEIILKTLAKILF